VRTQAIYIISNALYLLSLSAQRRAQPPPSVNPRLPEGGVGLATFIAKKKWANPTSWGNRNGVPVTRAHPSGTKFRYRTLRSGTGWARRGFREPKLSGGGVCTRRVQAVASLG